MIAEFNLLAEISWFEVACDSAVQLAEPQIETQCLNYTANLISASETNVNFWVYADYEYVSIYKN